MYDEPPHSKNIAAPNTVELQQLQVDREINSDFNMGQIREHDLILLSHEKISIKDKHDFKKITSVENLRSLIVRQGAMLALVTQKCQGGGAAKGGGVSAPKSIECMVDVSKSFYLGLMEEERSYSKFYVYYIESLSVNLREYRTIRMSEFYGMVDTLLHPSSQNHLTKEPIENTKDNSMRLSRMDDFIQQNR